VADDENVKPQAEAKQQESRLVLGMIRIVDDNRVVVEEDSLRFLKRDAVLYAI